jgi:hypothetical protein
MIKQVSKAEFLKRGQFDAAMPIQGVFKLYPDAVAVVLFENQNMSSSRMGEATALAVGPSNTFKSVADCEGKWLKDLPSQRQYPTVWCSREDMLK